MKAVEIREFVGEDGSLIKGDVVDIVGEGNSVNENLKRGGGQIDDILKKAVGEIAMNLGPLPEPKKEGGEWTDERMEELIRLEEEEEERIRNGGGVIAKAAKGPKYKGLKGGFFNKKKKSTKKPSPASNPAPAPSPPQRRKSRVRIDESQNTVETIESSNLGIKPPPLSTSSMTRRKLGPAAGRGSGGGAVAGDEAGVVQEGRRKNVTDGGAFSGIIKEKNVEKPIGGEGGVNKPKRMSKFARDRLARVVK